MAGGILLSIKPWWCFVISTGAKTVEVRKTRPVDAVPVLEMPYRCFIYCTSGEGEIRKNHGTNCLSFSKDKKQMTGNFFGPSMNGKVIGEFTCKHIGEYSEYNSTYISPKGETVKVRHLDVLTEVSCIPLSVLNEYKGKSDKLYGWEISNLVIYDDPKDLSEFKTLRTGETLRRPPQSWGYVRVPKEDIR